jgi:hypothetical protein
MNSFTTWETPTAWQRMQMQSVTQRLRQAKLLLADCKKHIARLQEVVHNLERNGRDTMRAKAALIAFENAQVWHIRQRERLMREMRKLRNEIVHRGAA